MPFVIRTDKLSSPHYWAGVTPGNVGLVIAISPMVYNAWAIDDRAEAEKVIKQHLGDDWTISEISRVQTSKSLRQPRKRK